MLKHRLIFGTLMALLFAGIIVFDGWLDGSISDSMTNKPVQGTCLCILLAILAIPAQMELAGLAAGKNLKIFKPVAIIASILLATSWYWPQLIQISQSLYLLFVAAFTLFGLLLYQYFCYGTLGTISNCGANYFSIIYLGLLSSFILGIRIDFGLWPLLMFVFVVKSADTGAYTAGKLFGKHKFSPGISPGKTWEGMAGAVFFAIIVAVLFAAFCDIMPLWPAVVFGFCFAFIGQLGDLAESMIKRDAEQKDSAGHVPGFGGILDVIDSPLAAGMFGYLFFLCVL